MAKAAAADRGFILSSQGKASKALPEAKKFRRERDEFFTLVFTLPCFDHSAR